MSEHVNRLLDAYFDGELPEERTRQVRAHLSTCSRCQAELDQLRSLSLLLNKAPQPVPAASPQQFIRTVDRQLTPRKMTALQHALYLIWALFPGGLAASWGFIQAVFMVAFLVNIGLLSGLFPEISSLLPGSTSSFLPGIFNLLPLNGWNDVGSFFLQVVTFDDAVLQGALVYGILQVVIAVLFSAWLASWVLVKGRKPLPLIER